MASVSPITKLKIVSGMLPLTSPTNIGQAVSLMTSHVVRESEASTSTSFEPPATVTSAPKYVSEILASVPSSVSALIAASASCWSSGSLPRKVRACSSTSSPALPAILTWSLPEVAR